MIAYGPVPSRRLGRSLGVNNIPPKICSYSCVYCQLGRTQKMQIDRTVYYEPQKILTAVRDNVQKVKLRGESIDYLTFVSDGEPTLDIHLGHAIELLKPLGIKIAVITNASLIWREDVREDLLKADWVSLKMDSTTGKLWRRVNRPREKLSLQAILDGALEFAKRYRGVLATETMLVKGVNDTETSIKNVAAFLARLKPSTIYLAIPTKPPAERWVHAPDEKSINRVFQTLSNWVDSVEYLIGYEGNAFAFTGKVEEDLLSITAVHPMRKEAVSDFLVRAGVDWRVIENMIAEGKLIETTFEGHTFYMRTLHEVHTQRDDA
jgi:wyosine [tRNA(Phe)-imidazoG37] synthetase (radical SAM superfamily)